MSTANMTSCEATILVLVCIMCVIFVGWAALIFGVSIWWMAGTERYELWDEAAKSLVVILIFTPLLIAASNKIIKQFKKA